MDPLLFGVNGDVIVEVLAMIVFLSMIIERALSPFFEWRVILEKIKDKGVKEPIAYIVSLAVVVIYKFDALAILFKEETNSYFGYFLTAAVIAGGSKGSIKLFRDWMGFKSAAQQEKELMDQAITEAKIAAATKPADTNG